MIFPGLLRRGDVVRVIAPASPFDPDLLARGLAVLRDRMGLVLRHRDDIATRLRYLAGDDSRRLEEWREAVADPEARAIFCARGGYGSMRILDRIDPAPLLEHPKVLLGFSDVTAIHALLNRAGLATVHGPVLTQLGRAPAGSLDHLSALLTAAPAPDASGPPAPGAGLAGRAVLRAGRAEGPLLGGSLAMLAHLCGSRFQPALQGAILALEDVDERPYRLDRYLTQLRLAGALEGLAGVALGQFTECDAQGVQGLQIVREWAVALGVPAVEGFAFGHEDLNLAFPLGARATLVAPAPGEDGPPRLLFTGWAARCADAPAGAPEAPA